MMMMVKVVLLLSVMLVDRFTHNKMPAIVMLNIFHYVADGEVQQLSGEFKTPLSWICVCACVFWTGKASSFTGMLKASKVFIHC